MKSADIGLLQYIAEAIKNYKTNKSSSSVLTDDHLKSASTIDKLVENPVNIKPYKDLQGLIFFTYLDE